MSVIFNQNGFKTLVTLCVAFLFLTMCTRNVENGNIRKGAYLGEKLPGDTAKIFAPGIVSTGMYERDIAISPGGDEIYFGVILRSVTTIMYSKLTDGIWSEPEVASFATNPDYFYLEPHISPDGKKMMFLSTMPPPGKDELPGWGHQHIWIVDRKEDGDWGNPYILQDSILNEDSDFYPSLTKDGTLYFSRTPKSMPRSSFIYRSKLIDGKYSTPEKLPEIINKDGGVFNSFIAPDESYLIVCATNQDSITTPGFADYYIFYRNNNDEWSEPINPERIINFPHDHARSPYVTPDGKYFFFNSNRLSEELSDSNLVLNAEIIKKYNNSWGNGNSDIYWVKSDFIDKLRPDNF